MIWTESLCEQLIIQGWAYDDEALNQSIATTWLENLESKRRNQNFRHAQIAKNQVNSAIRGDQIYWLDSKDSDDQAVLKNLDEARQQAQRSLFLSMPTVEAHFAYYPAGGFYKRHCDQPKGKVSRILTFVVYLHQEWKPGWGGELAITRGDSDEIIHVIEPKPKRVVFFKSDEVWHEVRKSSFDRYSLTGWFRHDSQSIQTFSSSEKNTF